MNQRLEVKYYFSDHFFAGINLRFFDFGKADHMEYNLGYRTEINL